MKKPGTVLLAVGGLTLAVVGAWLVFATDEPPPAQQRPPFVIPVTLGKVEARAVVPRIRLNGTVRAVRQARLGFQVAGIVSSMHVYTGERVERGQLLATLDDRGQVYQEHMRAAELALQLSQLAKLEAGERVEDLRRLTGELDVAQADLELAQLEVARGRVLLQRDVIGQADLDRLVGAEHAALGRLQVARERLAAAEAGARVEDIGVAQAAVERARAELERAELERWRTELRAPWDGVVLTRTMSVGDYADLGEAAFELVDPSELEVVFEIPSAYGTRLAPQTRVRLRVDELPGFELEVPLTHRIPVADAGTRNFTGIVRLAGEDHGGRLEPGLYVRLELPLAPLTGAPVVPSDAVRRTDQGFAVARVVQAPADAPTPFAAELVAVRLLGADAAGSAVEPLGGELNQGDQVVVTGAYRVFPGAALAPQDTDAGVGP